MRRYVTIKKASDWGHVYYAQKPLSSNGSAASERGARIKPGLVWVLFPDGTEKEVRLLLADKHDVVHDMGSSYGVDTKDAYIEVIVHGLFVLVPLEKVRVDRAWWESVKSELDK